jgi:chemotaxis protein MotA
MDLGTLGGIIFGVALIIFSIKLGGDLGSFIDIPSVLCVGGGTLAALAITYPIPKMLSILNVTKKTLMSGSLELTPWYQLLVELAALARRDGILALEDRVSNIEDEFLKKGLQMLVDGNPADVVTQILDQEIENMQAGTASATPCGSRSRPTRPRSEWSAR